MTTSHMTIKVKTNTSIIIHTYTQYCVYVCILYTLSCAVPWCTILLCVTLHCTMPYCGVLQYGVLYCCVLLQSTVVIVWCTVLWHALSCSVLCSYVQFSTCLYRVLCGGDLSQHLPSPRQPHTPHSACVHTHYGTRFRFENVPYGLTKLKENCHKLKHPKGGQ